MRRLLLVSLATISLTGCQFFNREDAVVIDPLATDESGGNVAAVPAGEGGEAFTDPTVEPTGVTSIAAPDLIRSTDPNARTQQVERSRTDPFASLAIPPAPVPIVVSPVGAAGNGGFPSSNAGANAAGNAPSSAGGGSAGGGSAGSRSAGGGSAAARAAASRSAPLPPPVRVQPNNRPLVLPSPRAALPPIPQPVIAPTISVSGVVQLGNVPYAIVRSGSEPERYVRVGDRIAGGSVRVKRIETLAFEPRVILEENGVEVSRPISADSSDQPDSPATPATGAQAALPTVGLPTVALPAIAAPIRAL
ncbi:MAG: hypothetical protein ACR2FS_00940 [Phormidesmis sp.]